jgi:hypothetical protein
VRDLVLVAARRVFAFGKAAWRMSTELTKPLSRDAARALTEEVKADAAALWTKLLRLYEDGAHTALGYSSWADYCAAEFDMGRSHAYRLLDAGRVVEAIEAHSPNGDSPPSEAVAREFVPVLREDQQQMVKAWEELKSEFGDAEGVTAERAKRYLRLRFKRDERERDVRAIQERRWQEEPRVRCEGCFTSERAAVAMRDGWVLAGNSRGSHGNWHEHNYCPACYIATGMAAEDAREYADDLDAGRGYCHQGHGWQDGEYAWGGWRCPACCAGYEDDET